RQVRVVRGTMRFNLDLQPRFDYARSRHTVQMGVDGATFVAASPTSGVNHGSLTLHMCGSEHQDCVLQPKGHGVTATRVLPAGQTWGVGLESKGGEPRRHPTDDIRRMLHDTTMFWRHWLQQSTYRGRWREMVARSAITLKLMQYAPTGA